MKKRKLEPKKSRRRQEKKKKKKKKVNCSFIVIVLSVVIVGFCAERMWNDYKMEIIKKKVIEPYMWSIEIQLLLCIMLKGEKEKEEKRWPVDILSLC